MGLMIFASITQTCNVKCGYKCVESLTARIRLRNSPLWTSALIDTPRALIRNSSQTDMAQTLRAILVGGEQGVVEFSAMFYSKLGGLM